MKSMIEKVFSIKALVALLLVFATSGAWADFAKTNPVTGETETYANKFTGGSDGTGTEWSNSSNWDPSVTPFIANTYTPSLVSNKTASTSTAVDGWTLRVGAYNGATVAWNGGISKIQAGSVGAWLTADATSAITIASFGGKQLEGSATYPLKLTSANVGGITWNCALSATTTASDKLIPFHYYIDAISNGSVVYTGNITVANDQVIKQVNIKLTGTSQVSSKTLVSFGSGTTKTFTADAAIKVYDTDGTTLATTVNLATVNTTGSTTLTTSDPVGTVELVQTSTGVVLYYVDGDPADVNVGEKTYKPSISVNFTSGTALSTAGDVGLAGYAVPGTSWNNLTVANNATLSSLNKIDSTGAATASSASVTITNTRGYWTCSSLVAASDMRAGYIDETADVTTPTVTVSGIPYDQYKVIVYTATDAANVAFGYVTINGTDYTYANGAVAEGTAAWGASGAKNTAEALAEGVNVLVSPVVSGATLTVVGHRSGNDPRGCIAAVQIVKVEQELEEGDLLIELEGDRTYTFDEAKAYSGTVYVLGEGTLTFDGAASTATTLHIGPAAAVKMVGSALTPTAVTGNGTVVYDGAQPETTLGFDDSANWTGTVWVKNVGAYNATGKSNENLGGVTSGAASANPVNNWGNAYSFVKFTNVKGYMYAAAIPWTLILEDDGANYAWYNNNGWGSQTITIAGLKGDGTFYDEAPASGNVCNQPLNFTDGSAFLGTIYAHGKRIGLGGATTAQNEANAFGQYGSICIPANGTATVSSGKTWSVYDGFIINGTLNDNGTLATLNSSAASIVSGSGTVVFTGRAPTPVDGENETKWWKNANWTGTVQIANVTDSVGDDRAGTWLKVNDYGNTGSVVEFNGVTGWLTPNYTCTVPLKITNTLTINNGSSGVANAFKVKTLKGNGNIYTSGSAPFMVFQITEDWSEWTGRIQLSSSKVVAFGSTVPSDIADANADAGTIYIASGAEVEIKSSGNWWASGVGFVVNGTLKAAGRDKWGGGTAMVINDTGILELTSTGDVDESNSADYDYSNVTGTGTIKFNGTGYRGFPYTSPADTLSIVAEQANGLVFRQDGKVIGSLSGTKNLRSDLGGSDKTLTIKQAKDGVWSGIFKGGNDRLATIVVAPGDSTTGTLTLAGTQDQANWTDALTVSGSVNLTGTWQGDTTVSGTFCGTGTLTGNLTFSDGATFKANTSALTISGSNTVTFPSEGSVTVDLTSIELSSSGTTLISGASSIANSANLTASGAYFAVEGDGTKSLVAYAHVATYSGVKYATFADAIAAALADEGGEANLASITVVDATAELPAGYLIVDNNVVKAQGAIVDTEGTAHYYATPTAAAADIDSYLGMGNQTTYSYFAVYFGTDVEMSVNLGAMAWNVFSVKVKCLNDATVSVVPNSVEYEFSAGTPDESDIVTYTKIEKATTYVWAGTGESPLAWANNNKWKIGTSEGAAAARAPSTLDTVIINGGAPISISGVTVAAMQIGGDAKISGSGTLTATTGGIVLTDAAATLTVTGVTLSPAPTTTVANSYVKLANGTYSVVAYYEAETTGEGSEAVTTITTDADTSSVAATVTLGEGYAGTLVVQTNVTSLVINGGWEFNSDKVGLHVAYTGGSATHYGILKLEDGNLLLRDDASAVVNGVKVVPEVNTASSPMTLSDTTPGFTVKTIPGLFYVAETCSTPNGTFTNAGNLQQATSASTTLSTNNDSWGENEKVRYYRIKVSTTGN